MTRLAPLFTWRSAISESTLPSTTRHVALALSLYMNERGGSAHPGAGRLAKETALNVATVREHLAKLVEDGWLVIAEQGGQRGEKRKANEYVAHVPSGVDDPSFSTTGRGETTDPSSSPRRPVVLADPISKGTHQESPPGEDSPEEGSAQRVVASYVNDFKATHRGKNPPSRWRNNAGRVVAEMLADGDDDDVLGRCLAAIAKENKDPSTLRHVVADFYSSGAA